MASGHLTPSTYKVESAILTDSTSHPRHPRPVAYYISLADSSVYNQWRLIGTRHQLVTDDEIAVLLMQCYRERKSRASASKEETCADCQTPLRLLCPGSCSNNNIPLTTEHKGDTSRLTTHHKRDTSCLTTQHKGDTSRLTTHHKRDTSCLTTQHKGDTSRLTTHHKGDTSCLTTQHKGDTSHLTTHHKGDTSCLTTQHKGDTSHLTTHHKGDTSCLTTQHKGDTSRLTTQHKGDTSRLTTQHKEDKSVLAAQCTEYNSAEIGAFNNLMPSYMDWAAERDGELVQGVVAGGLLDSKQMDDCCRRESSDTDGDQLESAQPCQHPEMGFTFGHAFQGTDRWKDTGRWKETEYPDDSSMCTKRVKVRTCREEHKTRSKSFSPSSRNEKKTVALTTGSSGFSCVPADRGRPQKYTEISSVCAVCDRTMSSRRALLSHITSKHPEAELPASIADMTIKGRAKGKASPTTNGKNNSAGNGRKRKSEVFPTQSCSPEDTFEQKQSVSIEEGDEGNLVKLLQEAAEEKKQRRKRELLSLKCETCGTTFEHRRQMYTHRRLCSWKVCHLCGKSVKLLDMHLKRHSAPRRFPCPQCPKSFLFRNYLVQHMLYHNNERPHCCEVCGVRYRERARLNAHLRTHSGTKPFKCSLCDAAFTRNRGLKDHQRVHTKEKPYGCQVCGRQFSSTGNLAAHRRKVHKMEPLLPNRMTRKLYHEPAEEGNGTVAANPTL